MACPTGLEEIAQLGRTLSRRRADILAFFDHHASNGPTEAINGRLEALRRNALGFRNLTNYRWRSLLHSGALHHSSMHSELRRARSVAPGGRCVRPHRSIGPNLDRSVIVVSFLANPPCGEQSRCADHDVGLFGDVVWGGVV